ncbi:peptidoglycan-binding domain-containing protein [Terasakiella pusilla]|uniref:peptidoglycan-binding domain-containing protein n=1 Tax=Terasakiella pusilla TaxID=64973 RepID=UPI003AA96AE9
MADNSWWNSVSTGFSDFADDFGDLFNVGGTISQSSNIKPDDVLKTKSALNAVGRYEVPDFGITDVPDRGMIDGLKDFQANNGLKIDGIMKPGGPTETALGRTLVNQGISASDLLAQTKAQNATPVPDVSKPAQTSWSASVPFSADTKPKKAPPSKIDPTTGLTDPLASAAKGKMPTKKQWAEVAKRQQPKTEKPILPYGNAGDPRFRPALLDKRFKDNHIMDFIDMAERPTHYSKQNEEAIRTKRLTSLEGEAFADMQNILLNDSEGFQKFPLEDRAGYYEYQTKRRKYGRPDRTAHDEAQVERNAIEASREASAGSYIIPEAKRGAWNTAADAMHAILVLTGADQEKIDFNEKTRQRKVAENPVPDIYKGRNIGKYAEDIVNLNPVIGALSGAGSTAKDLEKMGVSREGQRIGAALMGLVNLGGTPAAKLGGREIKDHLAKNFGKDWSKRLLPKDVEVLNDQLIGYGLQVGSNDVILNTAKKSEERGD